MSKIYSFILATIYLFFSYSYCAAQSNIIDNKDSLKYYLNKHEFEIDKNADAIILYESGTAFLANNIMTYKVERTYKILSQNAVSQIGFVAIPAHVSTIVNKVKGVTYNMENNQIIEQKIEKADIVKDKVTNNYEALKFNLPSMKAGSIVHFTYTLTYNTYSGIPDWYFQKGFPVLLSTYQASIPVDYRIADVSRSNEPFEKVNKEADLQGKESAVFNTSYGGTNTNITTWVRRNVPALKDEVFRKGANNYLDRVKVYITGIHSSWDLTSKIHMGLRNHFSTVYDANIFAKKKVKELTMDKTDELEQAKVIYAFVRDNFIISDFQKGDEYINLKKTFESQKGKAIEINLVLITMLLKANLNAELVLLALKPNEPLNPIFPDFNDINYIIAKVRIKDKDYFLDPTQKYLGFGQLIPECYNGYSRIMSKKSREVYIDNHLLQDKINVMANLKFDAEKQKMILTIDKKLNDVTAFTYRDKWKGDEKKALKELRADFNSSYFQIENMTLKNIADPDQDLLIHLEASADFKGEDKVLLNGYLDQLFKTNPLPAAERVFPIAFDYKFNYNYYFNLQLPDGYTIEYLPESKMIGLEQSTMVFSSLLATNEAKTNISLSCKFQTSKTIFDPQDYLPMRSLFETMLQEQNKNIIIKKVH